ncbi:Protein of unknown function, partial [Cotesia congregata]
SELIKLCFSKRTNPVVITDDLVDAIYGLSRDIDHPNVNVIDHNYQARQITIFNRTYPTYILPANSASQLKNLLHVLKSSPTWSIKTVFFIIGTNVESCGNASKMLQVLWKLNLISAFYVCYEPNDKESMMLYTYNPFTNRAPEPWVEVESTDRPDDRWSLYKQPYTNDKDACKSLTCKSYVSYAETLFSALNVTPIIYYDQKGYWNNHTASGYMTVLMDSTYNLALNIRKLQPIPKIDFINWNRQTYDMMITQRINIVRTVKNDETFLNFGTISVTILILVVTFVILVIHNGRDYGDGFLDIIRISIGSGIDAPLDKLPVRVTFIMTTLLFFVVTPDIQGQIFSYSTKPERSYPQNLKDLRDFKFNIHYAKHLKDFILEQKLVWNLNKTYLRPFYYHPAQCYDKVLNDSSNACLAVQSYQVQAAYDYNLHLAKKKKLNPAYISYWAKKDWVLKDKAQKETSKFLEMGLFDFWDKQQSKYIFEKFKAKETVENAGTEYDDIEFENLASIYLFIFLSYLLGILIFVTEILIVKYKAERHKKTIIRTLEKRVKYVGGRLIPIK